MSPDQYLIAAIRLINAVVWIWLGLDVWHHPFENLDPLARRLIVVVLIAGMSVLTIGAFAPYYIPADFARAMYTAYTGFAAMVAVAIKKTWRD